MSVSTDIAFILERSTKHKAAVDIKDIRGGIKSLTSLSQATLVAVDSDKRHVASIVKTGSETYHIFTGTSVDDATWGNTDNWKRLLKVGDVAEGTGDGGQDGADGVSVSSGTINSSGQLVLTLSNGQTINAGVVSDGTGTSTDTTTTTSNTLTLDAVQGATGFDLSTSVREVGRTRGVAKVRFTKTGTVVVGSLSVSGNQGQTFSTVNVGQTSPHSFTSVNIKRNTPGNVTFTLSTDTAGVNNATKSYPHGAFIYMGGHTTSKNADFSANVSGFDNTAATAVHASIVNQRRSLRSSTPSSAVTFSGNSETATSGKFTYIIVPKQFGTISQILDKNDNPITSDFIRITENGGEYAIPNSVGTSGFTHVVFIYVSGEDRQLMPTDQVKISF